MIRRFVLPVAFLGVTCTAFAADDDKVKDKLVKARETYDAKMKEFEKKVGDWFDAQEKAAGDKGNRARLDQLKTEREAFTKDQTIPKELPKEVKLFLTTFHKKMVAAYEEADREYTKSKKLDEAALVGTAKEEFLKQTAWVVALTDPFQTKSVWTSDDQKQVLTVTERNGESFRALFVVGPNVEREVSGTIKGGKVSWLAKDVRVVKGGGPGGDNHGTFTTDKLGEKIDFVFGPPNSPPAGKFTLRLSKGK